MFEQNQYELLDFGDGLKVERFGDRVIARESPSVDRFRLRTSLSQHRIDAEYSAGFGETAEGAGWSAAEHMTWQCWHKECCFELRQTPTGQVGVFPEQVANWDWIRSNADLIRDKKAINLFAYTGGSTMALAKAGASVVHVDSASSVVNWARENARQSELEDKPIRWIVDDAMKFLKREIKRGRQYDIFVADPPSFGRGKKNETWKIERDLSELVAAAAKLCPTPSMLILSCHTPSFDASDLQDLIRKSIPNISQNCIEQFPLVLRTRGNRSLPSGDCARFVVGH